MGEKVITWREREREREKQTDKDREKQSASDRHREILFQSKGETGNLHKVSKH